MADASAVSPVSGLRGDPLLAAMQASLNKLIADLSRLRMRVDNSLAGGTATGTLTLSSNVTDGGTAGKIKLASTITYLIGGALYQKAATDDLWDLTGETYDADNYKAYLLLLSTAGTASITGASGATQAAAIQAVLLKHTDSSKSAVAAFAANPASTFGDSAVTAQGTLFTGLPAQTDLAAYTVNWG